jgi:LTXXQ motif family protein
MTKFKALLVLVALTVLAATAYAAPRGGGGHGGGAPHGGGHVGGGHFGGGGGRPHFGGGARIGGAHFGGNRPSIRSAARPSVRAQRSFAVRGNSNRAINRRTTVNQNSVVRSGRNRNATRNSNPRADIRSRAVRNVLTSSAVAGAMHDHAALRNANARAHITASAATAGWHDGRGRNGWWRHRNGGYGWVGPLFWPFAYYDMYDYAMWGYGDDSGFWDYGYNDIYAGLFAPYGYDDLAGYLPQSTGGGQPGGAQASGPAAAAAPEQLTQMCGEDSRDIAGLPIDQIQQAIQPNDAQRAALDDLGNASVKAAQDIRAACPTQVALTAPARLASMQRRIEAMISAVHTVQPALQKFYDLLSDEQKARLNALGQDQARGQAAQSNKGSPNCEAAQTGVLNWPAAEIEARLHPTGAQRDSLASLQDASAKAADLLKSSCQTSEAITPPARLDAVGKRLDTMLQAIKMVRTALDDFYGRLSDEQKAQFEAIGPRRSASLDEPGTSQSHVHHRHHASIGGIIRRFISLAR